MLKPIKVKADLCTGCRSCSQMCSLRKCGSVRPMSAGVVVHLDPWRGVEKPVICKHCKKPPCVGQCPTGSLKQDKATGVVLLDVEVCDGCWKCLDACPFNAIKQDPVRGVAVKCDLCTGYSAPLCLTVCPTGALKRPGNSE